MTLLAWMPCFVRSMLSGDNAAFDELDRYQKPCRLSSASMRARDAVWRVGKAAK